MKKYYKTLLIIPCFLLSLPIIFYSLLRILPEIYGCEGFGCFGLVLLVGPLTVALTFPIAIFLYYLLTKHLNTIGGFLIALKTFVIKPFPQKKNIILFSLIPTLLLTLIFISSIKNKDDSKINSLRPSSFVPIPDQKDNTDNITAADFDNWKIFSSKDLGIEIKYPPEFFIKQEGQDENPVVKISDKDNFDQNEFALVISIEFLESKTFNISSDARILKLMDKIGYQDFSKRFANQTSYNFLGDPPWGYYQISIPSQNYNQGILLISIRLHRADEMSVSEGGTEGKMAETAKQILSTFEFDVIEETSIKPTGYELPVAGICADVVPHDVVEISKEIDEIFSPRCQKVSENQKIKLINKSDSASEINIPNLDIDLKPGEIFETPQTIGEYMIQGVHDIGGVEIWVQ